MPQHLRTARPHRHSLAFRRRNLRKGRLAGLLLVLLVAVPGVAACDFADKVTEPYRDAPRGKTYSNPVDIIEMPDGFNNIATTCGPSGMRFTSIYHGDELYGAVSVTPDPACVK